MISPDQWPLLGLDQLHGSSAILRRAPAWPRLC